MKKLRYNIFEAINLRGLTMREAGWFEVCPEKHLDDKIDFRMSIQMADDANWPSPPLVYEVVGAGDCRQRINKKAWKKAYGSWRKYMRQMYEDVK
jgi:hypothetical protein